MPASSSPRASRATTRSRSALPSVPSTSPPASHEQLGADVRARDHGDERDRLLRAQRVAQRARRALTSRSAPRRGGSCRRRSTDRERLVVGVAERDHAAARARLRAPRARRPTTAPSTQPPDTEPATSPASVTAIVAPGSRGLEPSVPTTRASATRSPRRSPPLDVVQHFLHRCITSTSPRRAPRAPRASGPRRTRRRTAARRPFPARAARSRVSP